MVKPTYYHRGLALSISKIYPHCIHSILIIIPPFWPVKSQCLTVKSNDWCCSNQQKSPWFPPQPKKKTHHKISIRSYKITIKSINLPWFRHGFASGISFMSSMGSLAKRSFHSSSSFSSSKAAGRERRLRLGKHERIRDEFTWVYPLVS